MALNSTRKNASRKSAKPQARRSSDRPRAAEAVADRSKAVAKTWKNKDVAAARSTKDKVKVNGVEYRSVLDAFTELKLPVGQHIPFRAKLKAAGRAVFTDEKDNKHTFTIVKKAD